MLLSITLCELSAEKTDLNSDVLRDKALKGEVFSQIKLGEEFLYGINRNQDLNLAFYYFNMAAEQGSNEGNYYLGLCYEYGYGVNQNRIKAYYCYEKAIELDQAKFKLALILQDGIKGGKFGSEYYRSIAQDKDKASKLLEELVAKKFPPAMVKKAESLLLAGDLNESNGKTIFELLEYASNKGDIKAKEYLIDCYLKGIGTKINEKKAFDLTVELYKKKVKGSGAKLAFLYENGIGTPPDMIQALKFYQEAMVEGNSLANVKMAEQYLSGFYLKSDVKKAIELLTLEMKKNNPAAITMLADCFMKGIGMEKDEKQAFLLYLRSAGMGDVIAQYKLAECFRLGKGTVIDEGAVFFWLKQSAKSGSIKTLRELAICYIEGYGTEKDLKIGKELLLQCVEAGDKQSILIYNEVF